MKQKRFILQENELPSAWYNIQADMPNKPMPPIHPATKQPLGVDDLAQIFPRECCVQELDTEHDFIPIPDEVMDKYKAYRSTPLVRAYALEEALQTPAHIYFKNESVNPLGSHKVNSALAQCYYAKQEGTTNVTTETGAGQWGAALAYAASVFGLESAVYIFGSPLENSGKPTWHWIGLSWNFGIGIQYNDICFKISSGYGLLNHFDKEYTAQYMGYPLRINRPIVGTVMFRL